MAEAVLSNKHPIFQGSRIDDITDPTTGAVVSSTAAIGSQSRRYLRYHSPLGASSHRASRSALIAVLRVHSPELVAVSKGRPRRIRDTTLEQELDPSNR